MNNARKLELLAAAQKAGATVTIIWRFNAGCVPNAKVVEVKDQVVCLQQENKESFLYPDIKEIGLISSNISLL